MDRLFLYKMSEVMRVLLTTRLLQTGPEVEKGFRYSEVCVCTARSQAVDGLLPGHNHLWLHN